MGSFLPIGERLAAERKRLRLNQTDFAAAAGVTRKTLFGYESGERAPDAGALEVWAGLGLDVLFVVTGAHSNRASTHDLNDATSQNLPGLIDIDRLERIVELLERSATAAGKKWPSKRLVALSAEVYNVLADEEMLDDSKVERILKLVVNR